MNTGAFDSQIADWRQRRPELALAASYVDVGRRDGLVAFAAIRQQWQDDVIAGIDVLGSKLAWWTEEIARARRGEARHPLAATLFERDEARSLPQHLWLAPIDAALGQGDVPPASDFAAQLDAAAPFPAALAALETALWFGLAADSTRARHIALLGCLLDALSRLGGTMTGNAALPMNLLARHALHRDSLGNESAARDAAVHDQLVDLQSAFADAMSLPGPLSLFASAAVSVDRRRIREALAAPRPLPVLARTARPGFSLAWKLWREARGLRRISIHSVP